MNQKNGSVGLITLYETDNYGTCLQAYALSQIIMDLGYECEIISFNRKKSAPVKINKVELVRSLGFRRTMDIVLSRNYIKKRKEKFCMFRKKELPLSSQEFGSLSELEGIARGYGAVVTGSDMVWSWESRPFLDVYFLKFVEKEKRIAYAPSFGNTQFTEEMNQYYREAIEGFAYVSCRDEQGVEYIRNNIKKDCQFALDPTILLGKEGWERRFNLQHEKKSEKETLFYMFGEVSPELERKVKQKSERIRYIPASFPQYRYEKKYGNDACGPVEFLRNYYNAEMIITNAFHGLLFALIFKKPFILFHREKEEHWRQHEERMVSLLKRLDLSYRYLEISDKLDDSLFSLDYTEITERIETLKKESLYFLEESIQLALRS